MAGTTRIVAAIAALALGLMLPCGSALAAPPSDSPGKSEEAPGQQKKAATAAESTPPGHAKKDKDDEPAEPQDAPAADPAPQVQPQAPEPAVESPRFTNGAGKPKHNVPAAAEAAPEASVSAPGNSGRHKLTICHKGHAITVDVHAARAHVDGHGDTYAVAGAKGRAACPHSSGPTPESGTPPSSAPTPRNETPSGPDAVRPDLPAAVAGAGRGTTDPGVATSVEDPATPPAEENDVSGTSHEKSEAVLSGSGVAGAALPFTGAPLDLLVLFGVGLVGGGLLLRYASLGWAARRSSSR